MPIPLGLTMFLISIVGLLYTLLITRDLRALIICVFTIIMGSLLFIYGWYAKQAEDNHKLNRFAEWFISH
jgi:hypothetical protein